MGDAGGGILGDLHEGHGLLHTDCADIGLGHPESVADLGQQPPGLGPALMADIQQEPVGRTKGVAVARGRGRGRRRQVVLQHFGRRAPLAPQPHEGRRQMLGIEAFSQLFGQRQIIDRAVRQQRRVEQTCILARLHLIGRGGLAPLCHHLGALQQAVGLAELARRDDQHRGALAPGAARPARAVQQRFRVGGQIGMDHQLQPRQVDAARGHVSGDTDACAPVAQRLQRVHPFGLRQLARQRHDLKAAIAHPRQQVVHVHPGLAEDDRGLRLMEAQDVEDRMFAVARRDRDRLILDIAVLTGLARGLDAQRVALEGRGQFFDPCRHRGREHQRAPGFGCGLQDELQILGKAQVQHLVGFVQNDGLDPAEVKAAALDMVAQAAGGADDDMRAPLQRAALVAIVHAAHAGRDLHAGLAIEPRQLACDLQRQFTGGGDGQRQRLGRGGQHFCPVQHFGRHRDAECHRLARSGLRRNQQVAPGEFFAQHSLLNRRQAFIALGRQRLGQCRGDPLIRHFLRLEGGICPMRPCRPFTVRPPAGGRKPGASRSPLREFSPSV